MKGIWLRTDGCLIRSKSNPCLIRVESFRHICLRISRPCHRIHRRILYNVGASSEERGSDCRSCSHPGWQLQPFQALRSGYLGWGARYSVSNISSHSRSARARDEIDSPKKGNHARTVESKFTLVRRFGGGLEASVRHFSLAWEAGMMAMAIMLQPRARLRA